MALEWFKPDLLGTEDPEDWPYWMDSWKEFIIELQTTFGSQPDHLQMKDNHQVNKYMVEFNWLASQVWGYGDGALHHFFYTSLPDCIKDKVCWVGKPRTLHELHHLAQEIDTCYWECKEEIQWSTSETFLHTPPLTVRQISHHPVVGFTSDFDHCTPQPNPLQLRPKKEPGVLSDFDSRQPSSKPASTSQTGSNTPKLDSSKLGKDGKLTPEECKHCKDNNLCMFCGGTRHFADKCPKKAGKAKAHAVATSEATLASTLGSAPKAKK
ncbi:hypothetical protein M404DRAFT_18680 [Pisolithus tinctorius Marx 270]|uniref:CCHC-type domain-containing protein n=1 Tax=Pisolithus tinctorius Marx 270 TaxID=870435 RepID=A0A0C3PGT8_PISTI|nr:hypothetical protein M404DRAFT_18680 [Pisolithus tinctorius Marx 270]